MGRGLLNRSYSVDALLNRRGSNYDEDYGFGYRDPHRTSDYRLEYGTRHGPSPLAGHDHWTNGHQPQCNLYPGSAEPMSYERSLRDIQHRGRSNSRTDSCHNATYDYNPHPSHGWREPRAFEGHSSHHPSCPEYRRQQYARMRSSSRVHHDHESTCYDDYTPRSSISSLYDMKPRSGYSGSPYNEVVYAPRPLNRDYSGQSHQPFSRYSGAPEHQRGGYTISPSLYSNLAAPPPMRLLPVTSAIPRAHYVRPKWRRSTAGGHRWSISY